MVWDSLEGQLGIQLRVLRGLVFFVIIKVSFDDLKIMCCFFREV